MRPSATADSLDVVVTDVADGVVDVVLPQWTRKETLLARLARVLAGRLTWRLSTAVNATSLTTIARYSVVCFEKICQKCRCWLAEATVGQRGMPWGGRSFFETISYQPLLFSPSQLRPMVDVSKCN